MATAPWVFLLSVTVPITAKTTFFVFFTYSCSLYSIYRTHSSWLVLEITVFTNGQSIGPDRRLTQLSKRRWVFYCDKSLEWRFVPPVSYCKFQLLEYITCTQSTVITQIRHGVQDHYSRMPMPSSLMFTLQSHTEFPVPAHEGSPLVSWGAKIGTMYTPQILYIWLCLLHCLLIYSIWYILCYCIHNSISYWNVLYLTCYSLYVSVCRRCTALLKLRTLISVHIIRYRKTKLSMERKFPPSSEFSGVFPEVSGDFPENSEGFPSSFHKYLGRVWGAYVLHTG